MARSKQDNDREMLRDLVAAYINDDKEAFWNRLNACNSADIEDPFFCQLLEQIEDGFYHIPKVPKKRDGSPDMGSESYRVYVLMDTELYAIYKILQHNKAPEVLSEAYDTVYPYFYTSRWRMDEMLDRFFAETG